MNIFQRITSTWHTKGGTDIHYKLNIVLFLPLPGIYYNTNISVLFSFYVFVSYMLQSRAHYYLAYSTLRGLPQYIFCSKEYHSTPFLLEDLLSPQ